MTMRHAGWLLLLGLTACTSSEEKARQRELQMIAQAQADSAAEADFISDSLALDSTVTLDSIRELRIRDVTDTDDDGNTFTLPRHEAIGAKGQLCAVTTERYMQLAPGDTLRCQWGPPE